VLKKGGTWREAYGVDEKKVAGMVREDKIDILVELTAPVQVLVIFNFIILMSIYVQVKKISGF
jgi:predicted O-linked N-acetylglucosamine transferase (SPINDLY family)